MSVGLRSARAALAFGLLSLCATSAARAESEVEVYAIVIGNNRPPAADPELPWLRYADDDAIRYHELFRRLAVRSELLVTLDATTARRHPGLAARAEAATLGNLHGAVQRIAADARSAKARGRMPTLFVVYSGHGGTLPSGESHLVLDDAPLTRAVLDREVITAVPGLRIHLIVDACNAAAVVGTRGTPGREVEADRVVVTEDRARALFEQTSLRRHDNVGVLLASAPDQATHEWSRIESGVFSHVVISALLGAADINADRRIEYSEVQAFVAAAHRELKDPRAQPTVIAHPPSADPRATLVELDALRDTVFVTGNAGSLGRFHVELDDGTRWLEAHLAGDVTATLALPAGRASYLRRRDSEAVVRAAPGTELPIPRLRFQPRDVVARGSIDASLRRGLFGASYGRQYYLGYVDSTGLPGVDMSARATASSPVDSAGGTLTRDLALAAFVVAGVALAASAVSTGLALGAKDDFDTTDRQRPAADAKARFERYRAVAFGAGALVLLSAGAGTYLWLDAGASPSEAHATATLWGSF